ncbi:MAG: RNA polymerase sigma factor [Clostridia bacterium]|nr:RNA polymerase sigma factor [Clostridia bacterium]
MTLDQLMKKLAVGEQEVFESIYAKTHNTVFYIALSILKERSLAEDVMQTTYLQLLRNASQYRHGTNANAWIAKITRNEALKVLKKRERERYVDETQNLNLFGTGQTDDYELLIDLARKLLPEDEFVTLMLVTAAGYKRREIAKMFKIPLSTVTWRYQRALEKLRDALNEK